MKNYIEEFCLKATEIILNKEAGWSKKLEEEAEKLSQSATLDTARKIGSLAMEAGLSVINLDKQEDWNDAVEKIRQSAKKEAVEECLKAYDENTFPDMFHYPEYRESIRAILALELLK